MNKSTAFAWTLCAGVMLVSLVAPAESWQQWTGDSDAPFPGTRDGHTMVMYDSKLVIFGGRSNEVIVAHTPKTFDVEKVNGTLSFTTYDEKPVYPCVNRTAEECNNIQVGRFYNDVWSYNTKCTRGWDTACVDQHWTHTEAGAALGGCLIQQGVEVCSHPHERFGHVSAVFDDGSLVIYGGFSRMCEDYCHDMWVLRLSHCPGTGVDAGMCEWKQVPVLSNPGKRWRMASTHNATSGRWVVFGGARVWHGFSPENSLKNRWASFTSETPFGGYMDDMWVLQYNGTTDSLVAASGGGWKQILPRESCYSAPPTLVYTERLDILCTTHWPQGRASAALAQTDDKLYLHGGYRVTFPYPQVRGTGAGGGIGYLSLEGTSPFPSLPYYLGDMWTYSFNTGVWYEMKPINTPPRPRFSHTLLLIGARLVLSGGTSDGNFLNDLWIFDPASSFWINKQSHVHPIYPPNCTTDVLEDELGQITVLRRSVWGEPTRNSSLDGQRGRSATPILVRQPRRKAVGWDGCRDASDGKPGIGDEIPWIRPSQRAGHAAIQNKDASAMWIHGGEAYESEHSFDTSFTCPTRVVGDLWYLDLSHCVSNCSNHGSCILGHCKCQPGWYGLDCSNMTCPGDYCAFDDVTLQSSCIHCTSQPYVHRLDDLMRDPSVNRQQAHRLMFLQELVDGAPYAFDTMPKDVYQAFARKGLTNLSTLATGAGRTRFLLDEFEGGIDTSIAAAVEAASRIQHGICDGFGQCQCAPPFLGDDCSVLGCLDGCSGHGWCSVEYPVSRCMCELPWSGPSCSLYTCPNNCSFPNGVCHDGVCQCTHALNPYNRSQLFLAFGGEDCSYAMAFAGAGSVSVTPTGLAIAAVASLALLAMAL